MSVPPEAHDPKRDQYDGTLMLRAALAQCPPEASRLLVVTDLDLFIPMLTFIFGQAQIDGTAAIVSLARLRPEFYGLPPGPDLFTARYLKEALHEMGHTYGLTHCPDPGCTMSLSVNIAGIDRKHPDLCGNCTVRLSDKLDTLRRDPARPRRES